MPRTAKPVVNVGETLMLSSGNSPVRISQRPSKIIPRFLPAKPLVSAMPSSFSIHVMKTNNSILHCDQPVIRIWTDFLMRRINPETLNRLSPARDFARLRVHAHDLAFFNEQGNPHGETGFERCLFACATSGRVAAKAEFS